MGASTIAGTFAELVTLGSDRAGRHPNVLAVDLSVYESTLTCRFSYYGAAAWVGGGERVHKHLAAGSAEEVEVIDVGEEVSRRRGDARARGKLLLMPASSGRDDVELMNELGGMAHHELLGALGETIQRTVDRYDISAVVISCGQEAHLPYGPAAAELATVALLIGQTFPLTYKSFEQTVARFHDECSSFDRAKLKLIVNKVRSWELDRIPHRSQVFFVVPFTLDILTVPDTCGFALLLFEKYIAELVEKVLTGYPELIPSSDAVLDEEWAEVVAEPSNLMRSPRMKLVSRLVPLWIVGALLVALAISLLAFPALAPSGVPASDAASASAPRFLGALGFAAFLVGIVASAVGWYSARERRRIAKAIAQLTAIGPDWIFQELKSGLVGQRTLAKLLKLSRTLSL